MLVTELAKDLTVSSESLLSLLRTLRIPVSDENDLISEEDCSRVIARLERERRAGCEDMSEAVQAAINEAKPIAGRRRRRRAETIEVVPDIELEKDEEEHEVVPDIELEKDEIITSDDLPTVGDVEDTSMEELVQEEPEDDESVVEEVVPLEPPAPDVKITSDDGDQTSPESVSQYSSSSPARIIRRPKKTSGKDKGAPGQVRVQAEGYTPDGQRRQRQKKKRKQRQNVDQSAVKENIQRVMAELKGGSSKKRRRKEPSLTKEQREAEEEEARQEEERERTTVRVNEFLTVSELSELVEVPATELVGSAFKNLGIMVTINQRLDFDQIEMLLDEFGFTAVHEEEYEIHEEDVIEEDPEEDLRPRPPVVTVMGHVDHGKTLLLDKIRSSNVVAEESGGITQHIGAYNVKLSDDKIITFLDTPGHAAFTAMRARGAEITDIVILVVAADDSVMPQTKEAISHARNAGVPIVVAVNKCDLPASDPMKVKQELLQQEIQVEDFGGEILSSDISAKTGDGIDDLLEKVLLQAELLEIKANPNRNGIGVAIESQLDTGKGPVVSILVRNGTLRIGDSFLVGNFEGRVRAMLDERGNSLEEAGPGVPVQILGTAGVPQAGDTFQVMSSERASEIAQSRIRLERQKQLRIKEKSIKPESFSGVIDPEKDDTLSLIIKADVDGSVQALSDALEQLGTDEVKIQIIHRAVGAINEEDVLLAGTSGSVVIGFRVRPYTSARKNAERDGVEIRVYDVIYEAVDELRSVLEGMLIPEQRETIVGTAEVLEVFKITKVGTIAGSNVLEGVIEIKFQVRLVRDGVVVYTGSLSSLKRFKDDVKEVREGFECGIGIANFNDIKIGDIIECYSVKEIARSLPASTS